MNWRASFNRQDQHDPRLARFLVNRLEQAPAKVTRPSVSLLAGMPYTPSHQTDIRVTLDKARQALAHGVIQ